MLASTAESFATISLSILISPLLLHSTCPGANSTTCRSPEEQAVYCLLWRNIAGCAMLTGEDVCQLSESVPYIQSRFQGLIFVTIYLASWDFCVWVGFGCRCFSLISPNKSSICIPNSVPRSDMQIQEVMLLMKGAVGVCSSLGCVAVCILAPDSCWVAMRMALEAKLIACCTNPTAVIGA